MNETSKKPYLFSIAGVLLASLILLLVGSFCDKQIAIAMFDSDSYFGRIGAGYGQFPIYVALLSVGMLLFLGRRKDKVWLLVIEYIASIALVGFAFYNFMFNPIKYRTGFHLAFTIPFGAIFGLALVFLEYKFFKDLDKKLLLKVPLATLVAIAIEIGIWFLIKSFWGRPRPYIMFEVSQDYFVNWWEAGRGFSIKSMISPDILKFPSEYNDYFCSFPSGHTSNATLILFLLPTLGELKPSLKKYRPLLVLSAFAWVMFVAFSRLNIGAHYLSDVSMAILISGSLGMLTFYFFFLRTPKSAISKA